MGRSSAKSKGQSQKSESQSAKSKVSAKGRTRPPASKVKSPSRRVQGLKLSSQNAKAKRERIYSFVAMTLDF
ncbi:hypothetical protein A2482_04350 [Candidatus Falkowbacteria bacterium RIFOXYC2_FULL_48_21]|uniref:Uncharacterized protein n=1 Tax=Candidatus Falkowbacteria bacterium RIFOXYC2_FULL_48_21 TaxID=1798005 RepID=A0A1F5TGY4_9BACT|nr:MAG: hypothetical protein A2482_04350 [Candidatus Falkowbacteria bacterium RIFOXYC2_FULL_48_21]